MSSDFFSVSETGAGEIKIDPAISWSVQEPDHSAGDVLDRNTAFFTRDLNQGEENSQEPISKLHSNFKKGFISHLSIDDFEFGFTSKTEQYVMDWLKRLPLLTKDSLSALFIESLHDESILLGILKVISHIEYESIRPTGQVIALAALSNENLEVRECAIRAFENWEHKDGLRILESVVVAPEWLNNYLMDVVENLRSCTIGNSST